MASSRMRASRTSSRFGHRGLRLDEPVGLVGMIQSQGLHVRRSVRFEDSAILGASAPRLASTPLRRSRSIEFFRAGDVHQGAKHRAIHRPVRSKRSGHSHENCGSLDDSEFRMHDLERTAVRHMDSERFEGPRTQESENIFRPHVSSFPSTTVIILRGLNSDRQRRK